MPQKNVSSGWFFVGFILVCSEYVGKVLEKGEKKINPIMEMVTMDDKEGMIMLFLL